MSKKQSTRETKTASCIIYKEPLISKLEALAEESCDISKYVGSRIRYGRALGYAEGKLSAYVQILDQIHKGEFDLFIERSE